ncbi:MAG: choice-of-anchor B family protein [Bacteroidetes bacterium]|nr:choice-of-anchor B family protein [Bacteroidota bacterium]MDA0981235.1 choice-of-anchor B family protein [Bacteroidota bacterium]
MKKLCILTMIFYAGFQLDVFSQQLCDDPFVEFSAELTTGIWAQEITWSIYNDSDELIAGPFSGYEDNSTYLQPFCLEHGCYYALLEDSYGDGWQGGGITFYLLESISGTVEGSSAILDLYNDPSCGMLECTAGTGDPYYATISADLYGEELSWGVVDSEGTHVAGPYGNFGEYITGEESYESFCLIPECYTVLLYDSYGDGWQGAELTIEDASGVLVGSGLVPSTPGDFFSFALPLIEGCPVAGCMNIEAFNYNSSANVDDGSCMRRSDNVTLVSNWTDPSLPNNGFGGAYNDVDGLEVGGIEYAVMASTLGTHIIDISSYEGEAIEVAFLPGADGGSFVTHRDYHIDGTLLFAVCDQGASSLQIFDLSNLPATVTTVYDSDEFCITAHNVFVDNDSDLLYLCSTSSSGSNTPLRVLDVSNPSVPTPFIDLSPWVNNCHDIYVENDTAWVNAGSGLFVLHIDATPTMIGTLTDYPFQGSNHSGWWIPEDNVYVLADETHGSPLKVIDTSDMTDLQVVSTLSSGVNPQSIPHNMMMRDGLVFVSYYHDGLQVFDVSTPEDPKRIAWFDTFIESSHAGYAGAWGVHSSLPSGRILISDITNGLFVLELAVEEIEVCPLSPIEWNGLIVDSDGYYSSEVPNEMWGTDIELIFAMMSSDVCPTCPGDLDYNGSIGVSDLTVILANIGCTIECDVDLDGDNSTTVGDLLAWLSLFGSEC